MDSEEPVEMLDVFKALAHESRLKLLGLVAQREHSVQELATRVELKEPTVSHHLALLKKVGLVTRRPDGNTHWYALAPDAIVDLARRLATPQGIAGLAARPTGEPLDWAAKVVETFVGPDGRLKSIPAQRKKRWAILAWLVRRFEEGRRYPEKALNAILLERHWDSATLRRELIGYRMMARESGVYWRLPEDGWVDETGTGYRP